MAISNEAPAWRRAFLRELARSGNVARAAEKAGIHHSNAYRVRDRNPAFAASWDRARAAAWERLVDDGPQDVRSFETPLRDGGCAASSGAPQDEWGKKERPKLRANEIVRSSKEGRPCIARAGAGRWSSESERAFLAELRASANVKAAARAAGVSSQAAYSRRKVWPGFAEAWREAKAEGYERIEMLLIHAATVTLDPEPSPEAACEAPPMTVEQAMNLFKLHRASQSGGKPQRYGWRQQEPDIEEVRAEILRKVAAIKRARPASNA
jgi:hypothetical protein